MKVTVTSITKFTTHPDKTKPPGSAWRVTLSGDTESEPTLAVGDEAEVGEGGKRRPKPPVEG